MKGIEKRLNDLEESKDRRRTTFVAQWPDGTITGCDKKPCLLLPSRGFIKL